MASRILEREPELRHIAAAAREVASGAGCAVLVSGEAGIGKSSLVEAARGQLPAEARMLVGYCDDLATPRTLGPFRDLAGSLGAGVARALRDQDRDGLLAAVRSELDWPGHPTVLVVEDVHWADDATLDVLRYLVRRVASLPVLLLLTYRDDEIGRDHPLRRLLGSAAESKCARHLALHRLSETAVRELSSGRPVDPADIFAVTSGNPFFVSQILDSDVEDTVPPTVTAAVNGRVHGLPAVTQDALDHLAVVPFAIDRWLVDRLVPESMTVLEPAERYGLLTISPGRVAFRHEITRRAIADVLPTARRVELNHRVLEAMLERSDSDPARVVHHASEAGDIDAIMAYGPRAAVEAGRAGAHREAAAHCRLALEHRERLGAADRADLLERYAIECYTVGQAETAVVAQEEAVALRRELPDPSDLGGALRWVSRMHWWSGDRAKAELAAREAIEVLEATGDDRLLALAMSNQSQLDMLGDRYERSIEHGERALELARRVGDARTMSHALANIGPARWRLGDSVEGERRLDEGLQVALAADDVENACRAYVNLIWSLICDLRFDAARERLPAAIDLADRSEFLGFLSYLYAIRSSVQLAAVHWDDATQDADRALSFGHPPTRCLALTVLGRLRARRGLEGADRLLRQAQQLADGMAEVQRTAPLAAARAEAAWLRGDHDEVAEIAGSAFESAMAAGYVPQAAELAYWLNKVGRPIDVPDNGLPYTLQVAGRWSDAVAAWQEVGCPYEAAAARAESDDPEQVLAALTELDAMGADPLARRTRRRLQGLGVRRIPRGPARSTRDNPAGLTSRQVDVLRLLGRGLTNAEIAQRLTLSVRTVEHHVAAILTRLGVSSRQAAAARSEELDPDMGR